MIEVDYVIFGGGSDIAKSFIKKQNKDIKIYLFNRSKIENLNIDSKIIGEFNNYDFSSTRKLNIIFDKLKNIKFKYIFFFHGNYELTKKNLNKNSSIEASIFINYISIAFILNFIYANHNINKYLKEIIVIGSVAGDRGKSRNPIYDSSKSALFTLCQGYKDLFYKKNINLLFFKPGNVLTKMTQSLEKKFFWSDPDVIARDICKKMNKNIFLVYSPFYWKYIMFIIKIIPINLFRLLKIDEFNK